MIKTYFLSIGCIFIALSLSYFVGLLVLNLIHKFYSDNSLDINLPTIPIGFGMISLISSYLYFNLNISSKFILGLIFFLVLLLFIYFLIFSKLKKIHVLEITNLFIISSIFIIFFLVKGEQFYIFRGNHHDSINYLSTALTIKDFNYSEIFQLRNSNIFPSESYIYTGDIIFRPLVKLILSFFLNLHIENYFFLYCIFKVFLICNIFISCRFFLNNLSIKNSYVYSFIFIFSFWFLYILEIDALSHLASYSFFILGTSFVINKNNQKIFLNKDNEMLFLLSSVLVLLFYSEIFLMYIYVILIFLLFHLGVKKTFHDFFKNRIKILLFFLILTIPTYQSTYKVIFLLLIDDGTFLNVNWWGYYGSFILGKINNFILLEDIEFIKNLSLMNSFNKETFYAILTFLKNQNLNHIYLNLIPSFFGIYHATNLNINYYLNLIFITLVNIILIRIIYLNFRDFIKEKNVKNTFLISSTFSFFSLSILFLFLDLKIWLIIKIYTYLSFFIYIFFINNNKFFSKKILNFCLTAVLMSFILSFPFYKYFGNNDIGVGKLDNFPSIINFELKNKINWETNNLKFKDCASINFDNQNKHILNYLSVKLKFEGFQHINQATFKNTQELNNLLSCKLVLEKHSFILKDVY